MTGAAWTPELDEQLREMVATGYTSQEIAAATNRTVTAIKSRRGEIRALSGYHWRSARRAIPPQPIDVRIRQLCKTIEQANDPVLRQVYRRCLLSLVASRHTRIGETGNPHVLAAPSGLDAQMVITDG